jgi:hypothetical protein
MARACRAVGLAALVNLVWGIVVVCAAVGLGVGAMLFVRRYAPAGSVFEDGDRAAGVFGVLATGFAILLGLIVFLAFSSYDQSRTGAETEALLVAQQYETAQFMPAAVRPHLSAQLVCYSRSAHRGPPSAALRRQRHPAPMKTRRAGA